MSEEFTASTIPPPGGSIRSIDAELSYKRLPERLDNINWILLKKYIQDNDGEFHSELIDDGMMIEMNSEQIRAVKNVARRLYTSFESDVS